jgi:hypothetical protein
MYHLAEIQIAKCYQYSIMQTKELQLTALSRTLEPTAISRRRSGIKSSLAQPAGRKPTLRKIDQCTMPDRKGKKEPNRKRNLSLNINLNKPNVGHTR